MHIMLKQLIHTFFYEEIYTPLQTYKLFVGKNGGKYNEEFYFLVHTNEGTMIMDKERIRLMDVYETEITAINYSGIDLHSYYKINDNISLKETMEGLEDEKKQD